MKNVPALKILSLTLSLLTVLALWSILEPGIVKGVTSSDIVGLSLTVSEDITIDNPGDVGVGTINLSTSDTNNTAVWTVTTNASGGYTLKLKASTDPAMKTASDTFVDYTEAVNDTPEAWSIAAGAYEFGWGSYDQTDVASGTWGSGSDCSGAYYIHPSNTQSIAVASRSSETSQSGVATTVCFRAAQGGSIYAPNGSYTATVTAYAATQ